MYTVSQYLYKAVFVETSCCLSLH